MGWTCLHYSKGTRFIDFCREEFNFENDVVKFTVLDAALVHRTTGYVALEKIDKKTNKREVFALVIMLTWHNNSYHNLCYKEMDETEGPFAYSCPLRILNLLTPTNDKNALKWRDEVRKYHEKREKIKRIKVGDTIKIDRPLWFSNGVTKDTFNITKKTRTGIFDGIYFIKNRTLAYHNWYFA